MTSLAWVLFGFTVVFAVGNWVAVTVENQWLEYVCKPATLALLIGVALAIDPHDSTVRAWFVAALVFSLAGDVFLMLPQDLFIPGLVSFLLGHIAYIVGLAHAQESTALLAVGVVVVVVAMVVLGRRIFGAVRQKDPAMAPPVAAYMTVISAMVVAAFGAAQPLGMAGALSFYASDATLAWNRFIEERPRGHLAVMVTYHLAQFGLVLSLVH